MAELTRQLAARPAAFASVTCSSAMLDIGDVHIRLDPDGDDAPPAILVERKTLADLAASLADGRYHEQKERSAASGSGQVVYVLEAHPSKLHFGDGMADVNGMSAARVQGCLFSLLLTTQVIVTRSVEETAGMLIRLGAAAQRRVQADKGQGQGQGQNARYVRAACAAASVRVRKRDNVDPSLCFLQQLCQIPGVSHGIATSIAKSFSTMRELISALEQAPDGRAREAQLSKVPMVGRKLSARICQFLEFV